MGLVLVLDLALATLLPILAWIAMAHPRLIAGVVFFIAFGLLLAVVWYRLAAPDVALAEAAIGTGITGVLLIGALSRLEGIAAARAKGPKS
ncbi:MAG: Na(+)/H(+) antiporter subunit B [Pseudomonadota bacterium]